MHEKKCSKCKNILDFSNFSKSTSRGGDKFSLSYYCKSCVSEYNKEKNVYKNYYIKNKKACLEKCKRWREKNIEYRREYDREYSKKNIKKKLAYKKKKYREDETYRLKENLRSSLQRAFKTQNTQKMFLSKTYGINYDEIINYLGPKPESNYEIDHILPCSSFNHNNPMEIWMCWNKDNFQWLPLTENRRKNNYYNDEYYLKYYKEKANIYVKNNFENLTSKLHLGCSNVYLENYLNIDINPTYYSGFVEQNFIENVKTNFNNYYRYDFCKGPEYSVVDVGADISKHIPIDSNTCDEVVMLHVLEHFPKYVVGNVLDEINRVLKYGGVFVVGVPDIIETSKLLLKASTPEEENWALRLIDGSQRNEWSHHFMSFSKKSLIRLLEEHGFGEFEDLPNINFYPAVHLKARKL